MIARKNKLSRVDIQQIKQRGKSIKGPLYSAWWIKDPQINFRLAVIVPAKYVPGAAKRNGLKRKLYKELEESPRLLNKKTVLLVRDINYSAIIKDFLTKII